MYNGIMVINKPKLLTSHDVVDIVRKKLGIKKVGHAGTLDPLAEGVLVILIGGCTKSFSKLMNLVKEYIAVVKLGEATFSGDAQSKVIETKSYSHITPQEILVAIKRFEGDIQQVPPMVSALHRNGKRLYSLARKGIVVDLPPRKVVIQKIEVLDIDIPRFTIYVKCSKGTYIRKLAEDIGRELDSCAHVESIKRISVGPFRIEEAISIDEISQDKIKQCIW